MNRSIIPAFATASALVGEIRVRKPSAVKYAAPVPDARGGVMVGMSVGR